MNYKTQTSCKISEKRSFPHREAERQPIERTKRGGGKSAIASIKNVDQLGFVFQDVEPPTIKSIFREELEILETQSVYSGHGRRVTFHKIRERKGPSLGVIQPKHPHERHFPAPNFEDRTQEDTLAKKSDGPAEDGIGEMCTNSTKKRRKQKDTMQHGDPRAHRRSRSVQWGLQFQCGASANCIFITGLVARKVHAETSKKNNLNKIEA